MERFQIISDLHLETPSAYDLFDIPPQAPYLALLGDIGNVQDDGLFEFIKVQLRQFEIVFFLLGNHEPFHSSWPTVKNKIQSFSHSIEQQQQLNAGQSASSKPLGKFIFLDQTRYDISSDLTVLGCTLYSKITKPQEETVSFGLNDFYQIEDWTVEGHRAAHEADLTWLNTQVSNMARTDPQRKIMVFTHHSPISADARAVDPRHANSSISSGFATDLRGQTCWESPRVRVWGFGHTHHNCDFTEERTGKRVIANQRGYYFSQAKGFDVKKVISI